MNTEKSTIDPTSYNNKDVIWLLWHVSRGYQVVKLCGASGCILVIHEQVIASLDYDWPSHVQKIVKCGVFADSRWRYCLAECLSEELTIHAEAVSLDRHSEITGSHSNASD